MNKTFNEFCHYKFKLGFTLAEVLITLGIIGVVAAITIPTLISNYQKIVWTNQLKKSYATLQQAFKRMLADDGVDLLSQTEVFSSMICEWGPNGPGRPYYNCKETLGKYLKILSVQSLNNYKMELLNGGYVGLMTYGVANPYRYNVIILADGSHLAVFGFSQQSTRPDGIMHGRIGSFYLDVNGAKGPNIVGRDIFKFYLGDDGILYPVGSKEVSMFDSYPWPPSTNMQWNKTTNAGYSCVLDKISYGDGCAARVLEEGKMNY